ncbi:MAG: hypothetical protein AAB588_03275 [Patescibacteria group bacterium]
MLKKTLIFLCLVIALQGGLFVLTPTALADAKNPCTAVLKPGDSIPDTFSVGDCLTTEGQNSLVPKKDSPEAAAVAPSGIVVVFIKVADLLSKVIASIALVIFMVGALLTIASEGKEDRLEKGKTAMLYAVIGLLVSFLAFIMVSFVQSVFY